MDAKDKQFTAINNIFNSLKNSLDESLIDIRSDELSAIISDIPFGNRYTVSIRHSATRYEIVLDRTISRRRALAIMEQLSSKLKYGLQLRLTQEPW